MQRLLARHLGVLRFVAVGAVVFFAGSALTTHLASKLLLDVEALAETGDTPDEDEADEGEDEDELSDAAAKAAATRQNHANESALAGMASKATRKQQSAEGIVGGNIFCPSCTPVEDEPLLASAGPQLVGERQSSLQLQLLATMESDDPTWSMATIRDLDHNTLGPYTANDQVRPGVTILSVERGRVVILNQGQREFIGLGAEPPPPPPTPAAKPAAPTTNPRSKSVAIEGAEQAINCSGANACTVDRQFVEQILKNPQQLMSQALMRPITRDGETAGFQVSRVRKGSLATMIGLENGDVISEINGAKLGNIDDALAMYQKLRRASHLSVTVERGGAVITKEISIK